MLHIFFIFSSKMKIFHIFTFNVTLYSAGKNHPKPKLQFQSGLLYLPTRKYSWEINLNILKKLDKCCMS